MLCMWSALDMQSSQIIQILMSLFSTSFCDETVLQQGCFNTTGRNFLSSSIILNAEPSSTISKSSSNSHSWLLPVQGMASLSLVLFSISVFHLLCFGGQTSDILLFGDRKSSFQIKPKLKIHLCLEQKQDSFFMDHKTFFSGSSMSEILLFNPLPMNINQFYK